MQQTSFCPLALLLFFAWCSPHFAAAQSPGKITGRVAEEGTGVTLPGVSVYLEEEPSVGTTTDADGTYVLLGVRPGTYTLVMSYVGFVTLKHADVEVFSGRTTQVDGELREEVFVGEEIVVTAEQPIVVQDRTSSASFIKQDAIDRLPVQEVSDLVRFQPGVVASGDGFHFRGGRTRETAYLIDGIPVQDVFNQGGGSTVDLEVQSVEELQVFTGTFDAEYGGAQSGIVSVTTRDPAEKLEGSLRVRSGGYFAGNDNVFVGGERFDPLETKDVALTLSGPLFSNRFGFFLTGRYEDRTGPLKGVRRFTAEDGARIAAYRRWYNDRYAPDDTRLIPLDTARTPGGTVLRDAEGSPLTFASGDGAILDMQWNETITVNPKLVLRPFRGGKLTYATLYNQSEGQGYSNDIRFAPDFRNVDYNRSWTHIATFTQALRDNLVLGLRGSYKTAEYESRAFDSIGDERIQFFSASDDATGLSLGGTSNGESRSSERQTVVASDLTWQVTGANEMKTGFQFRQSQYVIEDLDRDWVFQEDPQKLLQNFPYPDANQYADFEAYYAAVVERLPILVPELPEFAVNDRFDHAPTEWAAFLQNKLELDSKLVLKAGLRYEYFDVDQQRVLNERARTDVIGSPDNFEATPAKHYLSPRLGISYPISSRGAFRVAYGHFVQMPAYREMLKNPFFDGINVGILEGRAIGNPDLEPERTIKYEMGLQQQVADFVGIDVNLFYKDVRNLLGTEILSTLDNVLYTRTINRDYGLIRGGTFSIATRPVGVLLGASFDVTYSDARGSSSNPQDVANLVTAGRSGELGDVYVERQIIPLNWDQKLTANLAASVGRAGDWSVGVVGQLASGQPYTPGFLNPEKNFPDNEFDNAERKPFLFTFDLNAEKRLAWAGVSYGLRLQVNNLFSYLNERFVDNISGRAGQIVRQQDIQADRERVIDYVGLFTVDDWDLRPQWYSEPREITVGLSLNF